MAKWKSAQNRRASFNIYTLPEPCVVLFPKKFIKNKERGKGKIRLEENEMAGMERLHRMFAGAGGALGHPPPDSPTLDSSEQVYISSLALLKMLKHGKSRFLF